jgi:hypothetical protein
MLFTHLPSSIIIIHEQEGHVHLSNSLQFFFLFFSFRDSTISKNQFHIYTYCIFIFEKAYLASLNYLRVDKSSKIEEKRHENGLFQYTRTNIFNFIKLCTFILNKYVDLIFCWKHLILTFIIQTLTTFILSIKFGYLKSEPFASTLSLSLFFTFFFCLHQNFFSLHCRRHHLWKSEVWVSTVFFFSCIYNDVVDFLFFSVRIWEERRERENCSDCGHLI